MFCFFIHMKHSILHSICFEHAAMTAQIISVSSERILYMKFPIFASFIVFVIWLTFELKRREHSGDKAESRYWETELLANSTRKKSLDSLNYVVLPAKIFDFLKLSTDEVIMDCMTTLESLSNKKIVNFTGITNTELKLQYGAPNINLLIEYDQNYTLLVRTLDRVASILQESGDLQNCKEILEFAISTKSDISHSYKMLASIYAQEFKYDKILDLLNQAKNLNSAMKNPIVRMLQEYCHRAD